MKIKQTKEDIQSICKNPDLVKSDGMSTTEIALALGIGYREAKEIFRKADIKLKKIIKDAKLRTDLREHLVDTYTKQDSCSLLH